MQITTDVTVTLEPEVLNAVIAGLEQLPYRVAAPVIAELHRQILKQLPASAKPDE